MSRKPAIVLITCDELRMKNLGCYGNMAVATPNIDSLAESGVRFTECRTVSPWCLPARCAILTGMYPHRSGAYSNFRKCPLDGGIPNMFTALKDAGYRTTMFGKCHFAPVPYGETRPDLTLPYDEFKDYYLSLGLDHLDLEDDKQVSVWFEDDYAKHIEKSGVMEEYRRRIWDVSLGKLFSFPGKAEEHPDAWVGKKAVDYIASYDGSEPLFSWISFSGPHYPIDPPQEYLDRVDADKFEPLKIKEGEFDGEDRIHHKSYHGGGNIDGCATAPKHGCKNYSDEYWQRFRISYDANIALIDDWVGEIIRALNEKFGDDVLIIFTADHGEMAGHHGLWGKHNCIYDDVWKIPMIVKYPGANKPEVSAAMINSTDILPTVVSAAGAPVPKQCSGRDIAEQMKSGGYDYTFSEGEGFLAVTDGVKKLVRIKKGQEDFRELTDLASDPFEYENKISDPDFAADIARLESAMIDHIMDKVLP